MCLAWEKIEVCVNCLILQDLFEFEARVQKVPATYSNLRIKLQELSTILIA